VGRLAVPEHREPEVGQLGSRSLVAADGAQQVGGLEIPMDDAPGVGVGEASDDGVEHGHDLLPRARPPSLVGAAAGSLHGQPGDRRAGVPLGGAGVVEHQHMGMVEPGHGQDLGVEGPLGSGARDLHELQRDRTARRLVAPREHGGRGAVAEVLAEGVARHGGRAEHGRV
jgi:hypothetical protein